jgi:maltoporin
MPGYSTNIVSNGPRLEEQPYQEIDFYSRLNFGNKKIVKLITTIAFREKLFHYDGRFDADVAIRNLFAEVDGLHKTIPVLWVGSRLYRGDDIYLLDFWPLDETNTVGAGLRIKPGKVKIDIHTGVNRLLNKYQYAEIEVSKPDYGTEVYQSLNRQRIISSLKLTFPFSIKRALPMKMVFYSEMQHIPEGVLKIQKDSTYYEEPLPDDYGWEAGVQWGGWYDAGRSFWNMFIRLSRGLCSYGELEVPHGLDSQKRAKGAMDFLAGFSANHETGIAGIMSGGFFRTFRDADSNLRDMDDFWEAVGVIRPHFYINSYLHQAFEFSVQIKNPSGLSPYTGRKPRMMAAKFSIIPLIAPAGKGSYSRPQFRLIYTLSILNSDALEQFTPYDPRRYRTFHHYAGIQVEWWYNSTSYP